MQLQYHPTQYTAPMEMIRRRFPFIESNLYLAVLLALALCFFIFSLLFLMFSPGSPTINLAHALTSKWKPPGGKTLLEVHIANSGLTLLRGARIESIVGSTLTVSSTWNTTKMLWTIDTNESYYGKRHFGTSFFGSKGELLAITDFKVGDTIMVSGTFDVDAATPTIKAEVIR